MMTITKVVHGANRPFFCQVFVCCVCLSVYCSMELSQQEVYGLSCVLRRLSTNFSMPQFSQLGAVQLEALIRLLTQFTCLCAQKTVQEQVRLKQCTVCSFL